MAKAYSEGKEFVNFTELEHGDYENCQFLNCSFLSADLSRLNFINCVFKGCDLSLAKVSNSVLNEVYFTDCKVTGVQFGECNEFLFTVFFKNCNLSLSSFYNRKLKGCKIESSNLKEVDFTNSDCSALVFSQCDLSGAIFENTNLENADFRSAENYSINPEINKLKKARFTLAGLPGLLEKYQIKIG
jgi:fluoroquinolone resistance protein